MKILVFGGTGFFGKELVEQLLNNDHEVSLVSRGNKKTAEHQNLEHIVADRNNRDELKKVLKGRSWDIAYDQIGYCSNEAETLTASLEGKIGHLIFTSSKSIYDYGVELGEELVDPSSYELKMGGREDFEYAEGKRQAEAYYSQKAPFSVGFFRPPVVIGIGDTSERWNWHLNRIKNEEEIYFPNLEAHFCLILSSDAGKALYHMGVNKIEGAMNFHTAQPKIKELLKYMENGVGKKAVLAKEASDTNHSPYGIKADWYMSSIKARELGLISTEDYGVLAQKLSRLA